MLAGNGSSTSDFGLQYLTKLDISLNEWFYEHGY